MEEENMGNNDNPLAVEPQSGTINSQEIRPPGESPVLKRDDPGRDEPRGNNDPNRGTTLEGENNVQAGCARDGDIPTLKQEEERRVREVRAPLLQQGTPVVSTPNQPPPPPTVQHPLHRSLECTRIRWYRLHLTRGLVALKGKDSIVIEIKYRTNEGLEIDTYGKMLHDKHLSHLNIRTQLTQDAEEKNVTVVKGYHKVNEDCTRMEPIYAADESKEIRRGVWFLYDEVLDTVTPLESKIANKIEGHLEKFKPVSEDSFPNLLKNTKEGYTVLWKSVEHVEFQKAGSVPVRLVRGYPEEAKWEDGNSEVKHLMFFVHGIAHKDKESCVLVAAKRLGKGVDAQIKKANPDDISQIMFLPVHWRTLLEIPDGHKCRRTISTSIWNEAKRKIVTKLHEDLKLYDCVECGPKIRKIVIEQLKALHKKFQENNPNFKGPISLLGHSLGSVILYDILTNHFGILDGKENQLGFDVDKLFIIGSPLRYFLRMRGQSAIDMFRRIVMLKRFLNTYHPTDVVAARLEPLIDERFKKIFPVILKPDDGTEEERCRGRCSFYEIMAMSRILALFTRPIRGRRSGQEEGDHPMTGGFNRIDHKLERRHTFRELWSHSIYVTHPAFHLFLVNNTILDEENSEYQKLLDVGPEAEQPNPNSILRSVEEHPEVLDNNMSEDQNLVEKLAEPAQQQTV